MIFTGASVSDFFGASVAGAGDVNGDGFIDIIVGAPTADGGGTDRGQAYVFLQNGTRWQTLLAQGLNVKRTVQVGTTALDHYAIRSQSPFAISSANWRIDRSGALRAQEGVIGASVVVGNASPGPALLSVGRDGSCRFYADGNYTCTGAKNSVVRTGDGMRKLYMTEASENVFLDMGRARLEEGAARVPLDPIFLETIGSYEVRLTAYGPDFVYVDAKDEDGFTIRSPAGSSEEVFWLALGKRRGHERARLEADR